MTGKLFEILSQRNDEIVKAAMLGTALRWMMKNPLKTGFAALNAQGLVGDAKKMTSMVGKSAGPIAPPPAVTF
jgi:hypothetical protein